jgi:hypothetical protein
LRWLSDAIETRAGEDADIPPEAMSGMVRRHEADTRSLLAERLTRKPAVFAGLLALLAIIGLGVGIWFGQSGESGIQASLTQKLSQCDQPAAAGVSWAGCLKQAHDLRGAVLRNANLSQTVLERADLSGADLSYATLDGANLRGVSLRGAILRGASVMRADLTGADLRDADLAFAVLTGALMEGARLDGARLGKSTFSDGRVCDQQSVGQCR